MPNRGPTATKVRTRVDRSTLSARRGIRISAWLIRVLRELAIAGSRFSRQRAPEHTSVPMTTVSPYMDGVTVRLVRYKWYGDPWEALDAVDAAAPYSRLVRRRRPARRSRHRRASGVRAQARAASGYGPRPGWWSTGSVGDRG